MNNRRAIRLTIPRPCSADFEQMPDVGNGRFCQHCNKTVHDVSHLPDGALQLFIKAPERVCMQLHEDQVGRLIDLDPQINQVLPSRNISICLLHDLMPGALLAIPMQDDIVPKKRWFAGFLIDETNQLPLSRAIISIGPIGIAISDDSGWFKLFIPDDIDGDVVPFIVSLNTYADNYQEILQQSIRITPAKVYVQNNNTLSYHSLTKPTSVKISGACTFIQTCS